MPFAKRTTVAPTSEFRKFSCYSVVKVECAPAPLREGRSIRCELRCLSHNPPSADGRTRTCNICVLSAARLPFAPHRRVVKGASWAQSLAPLQHLICQQQKSLCAGSFSEAPCRLLRFRSLRTDLSYCGLYGECTYQVRRGGLERLSSALPKSICR